MATSATSSYQHQHQHQHQHHQQRYSNFRTVRLLNRDDSCLAMRVKTQTSAKRKSAVELLQETKPLYVKSEIVLDRKQELRRSLRGSQQLPNRDEDVEEVSKGGGGGGGGGVVVVVGSSSHCCITTRSNNNASPPQCSLFDNVAATFNAGAGVPSSSAKSTRVTVPSAANGMRKSSSSLQLQNKLRKLLNADSKENLLDTSSVTATSDRKTNNTYEYIGTSTRITSTAPKMTPFECYNSRSQFASNENLDDCQLNNFNCHKSLPDLSNASRTSFVSRSDKSAAASCESFMDETGKKSTRTDSLAAASCKNDRLHASTDYRELNDESKEDILQYLEYETNCDRISSGDAVDAPENSSATSPVKSCSSYITPPPLYCDTSELFKNRPVSRSKSDVGTRNNCSSLEPIDLPLYDSSNLNKFFDHLGLESDEYSSLTAIRSNASSPVYFNSNTSSVDSVGDRTSENENGTTTASANNYVNESPSIVERNARIIKWLCNCRKVLEQIPRVNTPQSR